ncbi:hypothetical protein K5E_11150 [Enterococcus thailandicus]|nr:hypothetical protein K4E_00970 [Enterococcus thailandicus]GMC08976.1 hypothetical protein K5E_11150 [Enterococcus thailandicus]
MATRAIHNNAHEIHDKPNGEYMKHIKRSQQNDISIIYIRPRNASDGQYFLRWQIDIHKSNT